MVLQLVRHQFTVKQFHQMAESGILSENERVELIRGEMIDMSPIGTRHSGCGMPCLWVRAVKAYP